MSFRSALLLAVELTAALVPQGLPAEVNTDLAGTSVALARQDVLFRQLNSGETLGRTLVICTGKTGMLTRNEMTVTGAVFGGVDVTCTGDVADTDAEMLAAATTVTNVTVLCPQLATIIHRRSVHGAFTATGCRTGCSGSHSVGWW